MAYKSGLVYNVFFVRWVRPEPGDSQKIVQQLKVAHSARLRSKTQLVYIAIIPTSAEPPDDRIRRELAGGMSEALQYCSSVFLVIEGTGLRHAMHRSIATGLFLLTGKRGKVSAYGTLTDALEKASLETSATTVHLAARNAGFVA